MAHYEERKARLGEVESGTRRMYLHLYYDDERAMEEKDGPLIYCLIASKQSSKKAFGILSMRHSTKKYYEVTQTHRTRSNAQFQAEGDR